MCNNGVVVVAVNKVKPFTHASGYRNVAPQSGAVVSGFFIAHPTSVLHTIVRPQPGGVEEKGYTVCRWLGGSSRIIRATGRIVKSGAHRKCGGMTIPSGGETLFLSTPVSGVGGALGEKIHRGLF